MIGYYVHHQGDGHATRAMSIAQHLAGEVTALSSRPAPTVWTGPWIPLARDDVPAVAKTMDPTAGGSLHWAPPGHPGLRERMAQIAAWVQRSTPQLMVVDVSVEVAVMVRAMGVPVVVMGMPGIRDDDAHQLAYRVAEAVIAPWPRWADVLTGGAAWRAKTHPVGAISRFDGRAPHQARPTGRTGRRRVLFLSGRGGTELTRDQLSAAQRATPEWEWTVLGPPAQHWESDPWPLLCAADIVVTHAGQNAIADIAAAHRPAVVVPQDRPHDEQRKTAEVLRRADLAVVCTRWPAAEHWPAILAEAAQRDGQRWTHWSSGHGGRRAAEILARLIREPGPRKNACARQ